MKRRCKLCGEVICGVDIVEIQFRFNNHNCVADPDAYTMSDQDLVEKIARESRYSNKEEDWYGSNEEGCWD